VKFYSYLWLRPDTTPYYAGKGSGRRAFQSQGHLTKRPKKTSDILVFYHATEAEAFASEKAFIQWFGREDLGLGCLHNFTDGGDDGYRRGPWTAERKAAQAERLRKQGIGGWNKGMRMPATAEKMKGNQHTKGKHTHSAEGNRRISESKKGKPLSASHCENLSRSHKGKPWSATRRAAYEQRSKA
jgi:hypothetical protein